MKHFQIITFILEIILFLAAVIIGVLYCFNIIKDERSWIKSDSKLKVAIEVFSRAVILVIILYFGKTALMTRIMDLPNLVMGKVNVVEDFAINKHGGRRDFYEHIVIRETEVKFFLGSGIKSSGTFKITYLPHSKRGINVEAASKYSYLMDKKIGMPIGPIIVILYCFFVIILLHEYGLWFLGAASIIYYPICLYYFVHYGRTKGVWSLSSNDGLIGMVAGVAFLIMLFVFYLLERFVINRFKGSHDDELIITKVLAHIITFTYELSLLKMFNLI